MLTSQRSAIAFVVVDQVRMFATPSTNHIVRIRHVKMIVFETHPPLVAEKSARTDTEQDLMRLLI